MCDETIDKLAVRVDGTREVCESQRQSVFTESVIIVMLMGHIEPF